MTTYRTVKVSDSPEIHDIFTKMKGFPREFKFGTFTHTAPCVWAFIPEDSDKTELFVTDGKGNRTALPPHSPGKQSRTS